ncbi:hypothetical protein C9374_011068 [Naegleria lovaniensis]|uniref:60S ribosomal protein L7a n=1 Tax=Naegleria lovaniensis TaxID=51637 RepID=A0AA88GCZ5_NAELO|nr:uncharacterized protein C9374_011068 [Naegleria lovaniensis]KAG2374231.1 hypothetical protein C9374_011068 [Naegleria lovaniensis]
MPPKNPQSTEKKAKKVIKSSAKRIQKGDFKNLITPRPKDIGIGRDLPAKMDLTRFVKWPVYVRLQRQKRVLMKRLKIPPAINQFRMVADKPLAHTVVQFLAKYKPEDPTQKKERLRQAAKDKVEGKAATPKKSEPTLVSGINEVVKAVERKQASLVVIAHDVEPIELVLFLPALCKKLDIPYVIVKSKSRLGQLVHMKNAAAVALTEVKKEDRDQFSKIVEAVRGAFVERFRTINTKWGGGKLSKRSLNEQKNRIKKL